MNKDILICGVGGQGTVLTSKILAGAAMHEGYTVHSAETIGMAQRGGPVTSHIRIGEGACSPLIPTGGADIIIGFEPGEVVRNIRFLRSGGLAVVNTAATKPVTEALRPSGYEAAVMTEYLQNRCRCIFADGARACESLGSVRFLNMFLLGIASGSGALGIRQETLIEEIARRVPERFRETNTQAFLSGYTAGQQKGADPANGNTEQAG